MAISLGRKLGVNAHMMGAVPGVPPTFSNSLDALICYENQNPINVETNFLDIVPLRATFTKSKGIVGRQLVKFNPVTYVQGPEALGSGTPWRFGRLLRACGMLETINGTSSIVYTPRSSGFESVAFEVYADGYKHVVTDAFGTFTMEANAAEGMKCTFDMTGIYAAPTVAAIPTLTYETQKAVSFVSASATIAGVTIVLKSFRLTYGGVVSERLDANAASGLKGLIVTDRNPTVEMVVEVDTALRNYFADLTAATTLALNWQIGTVSGNRVQFQVPEAQLTQIPYGDSNSIRTHNMTFRVQSATDDATQPGSELAIIMN
jgi:hypothetical protein